MAASIFSDSDFSLSILSDCPLFSETSEEEIRLMLNCLGAYRKKYKKEETIFHAGDIIHTLGIVLSGSVHIEINDFWGNKSILNHIRPGGIFAEAYSCVPSQPMLVNAVAASPAEILFLDVRKILQICSNSCSFHSRLICRLVSITAQKNLQLSQRILHTAPKTIRERLISYLSAQSLLLGQKSFSIPFNRQQLADYLNVDRSALSNELSKMQKDGILKYNKNHFELCQNISGLITG